LSRTDGELDCRSNEIKNTNSVEPSVAHYSYHISLNPPKGYRVKICGRTDDNCYSVEYCTKIHINDDDDDDDDNQPVNNTQVFSSEVENKVVMFQARISFSIC
jgi:hypothetical protein